MSEQYDVAVETTIEINVNLEGSRDLQIAEAKEVARSHAEAEGARLGISPSFLDTERISYHEIVVRYII